MKAAIFLLLVCFVGFGAGVWAASRSIYDITRFDNSQWIWGPWRTFAGDIAFTDPLTIARLAAFGPFPQRPDEALYITSNRDTDGNLLDAARHYKICGEAPDARFWSLTAYTDERYFHPNPGNVFTQSPYTVNNPSNQVCVFLGPGADGQNNGLPTNPEVSKGVFVILRLYQPSPALLDQLEALSTTILPTIEPYIPQPRTTETTEGNDA